MENPPKNKNTNSAEDSGLTKKILLVEDDPTAMREHKDALITVGYHVDAVRHCCDALVKLNNGQCYDVVLIDIDLPDLMIGELISFVRKPKEATLHTRIMALTTLGIGLPMVKACLNSGIINIIPKPLSVDYFLALLEETEEAFGVGSMFSEFE